MIHCYSPVETAPILDDLLETSEALYHKRVTAIQKVFTDQWFKTLREQIGIEQIEALDAHPVLVEARVRERLEDFRLALREKQTELIGQERAERALRDTAIRSYAASRVSPQTPAAA